MSLGHDEIARRLSELPGWSVIGTAIVRQYEFASFAFAVAFVTMLGFDAEVRDHHPDLHISYRKVTVTWTTHSDGGVTDKDFVGAREADRIAHALGHRA